MMCVVSLFIDSNMPQRIADILFNKTSNVCIAIVMLSLITGFISAFVDNVATLLIVAPIGIAVCKRVNISPVPVIIALSVSSNLQGAATLVGDTTSILLGGYANINFGEFFFLNGKFSIFWAVELGVVATIPIFYYLFRKQVSIKVKPMAPSEIKSVIPTFLLLGVIVCLILASTFDIHLLVNLGGETQDWINGAICVGICIVGLLIEIISGNGKTAIVNAVKGVDTQTILLLAGLFVVIDGIDRAGIIHKIGELMGSLAGGNVFAAYTLIVFASVLFSAFIDNIPYVATMLPVVTVVAADMGVNPILFYFGLLTGATLGGNFTPIGASANITGIGMLRKEGYSVKVKDFLRIGVPVSLTAVIIGYLFTWLVWKP